MVQEPSSFRQRVVAGSVPAALAMLAWLHPCGTPVAAGPARAPTAQLAEATPAPFECGELPSKAAPGKVVQVSARLGDVQATLSGTATSEMSRGIAELANPRLDARVDGRSVLSGTLAQPYGPVGGDHDALISITGSYYPVKPLCVATFGASHSETAVLVGLFTMGAHCCTFVDAYVVIPAGASHPVEQDIGNPGAELKAEDGRSVLVTGDNAFAYAFTAYAFSGFPVRVLELSGTKLANTTRDYPALVAADAASWWKYFEQAQAPGSEDPTKGTGLLAAWVADECNLGAGSSAWAKVHELESAGKLGPDEQSKSSLWPTGATYVKDLSSFLEAHGYCGP